MNVHTQGIITFVNPCGKCVHVCACVCVCMCMYVYVRVGEWMGGVRGVTTFQYAALQI